MMKHGLLRVILCSIVFTCFMQCPQAFSANYASFTLTSQSAAALATALKECPHVMLSVYCSTDSALNALQTCSPSLPVDSFDTVSSTAPCYPTPEACTAPVPETCSFYSNCLDKTHSCGIDGYALGYGLKYCSRFMANLQSFSTVGQQWINGTLVCLQLALEPVLTNPSLTCSDIQTIAFESHPKCYIANGFCSVVKNPADWLALAHVYDMKDIFSKLGWQQVLEVLEQCF
eukprot:ANDGO_03491.mRNA.1 hypothetical protein SPRG_03290